MLPFLEKPFSFIPFRIEFPTMMTLFDDCSWLVVTLFTVLVSGQFDPAMEVISADLWVDLALL